MNKNVECFNDLIKHFYKKSPNSILKIGISIEDETYTYNFKKNHISDLNLFGLGSISKTIISTYLSHMIKNNQIDMDKTIDYYLDLNPRIKYPTVLELATHTSGYHTYMPFHPSFTSRVFMGFNQRNIYQGLDKTWLFHKLNISHPLKKKKYRYSDFNYAVLSLLIETIERKPIQSIIINFLKNEIGMTHTIYGNETLTKDSKYSWHWHNENPYIPAGGLFSTIEDMLLFLNYQIDRADLLIPSHSKYFKTNLNKKVYTGFSWNSFLNASFFWHLGGQGYFRSYALFDTKRHITIIILATVDKNFIHVGRLGSSLYRNIKRNKTQILEYLNLFKR